MQPSATGVYSVAIVTPQIISERVKQASSVMFVFNRDFRYVHTYIYICVCGRTSSYMRMLNSSLLGNEKLRGPVVRNVGGVKFQPLSKA